MKKSLAITARILGVSSLTAGFLVCIFASVLFIEMSVHALNNPVIKFMLGYHF